MSTSPERKREAFNDLYEEHWAAIRAHVECVVGESDVDEVVMEVFTTAWRKLRPEHPMGRLWLLRTADNKLKDRARHNRSRRRAPDALDHAAAVRPDPPDAADVLAIRKAVDQLPERERDIVQLTYWDGLAAGEIAELRRTSQSAVWSLLTRARKRLRVELGLGEVDGDGR